MLIGKHCEDLITRKMVKIKQDSLLRKRARESVKRARKKKKRKKKKNHRYRRTVEKKKKFFFNQYDIYINKFI